MPRSGIDPWKYSHMSMDPATTPLYKNSYKALQETDFYNLDPSVIPGSVNPYRLFLHRYLRYEPYLNEMFDLRKDLHPYHPLMPTAQELWKLTTTPFFQTRKRPNLSGDRKRRRGVPSRRKEEMFGAPFLGGLTDSGSQVSPGDVQSDWSQSDFQTGSGGSLDAGAVEAGAGSYERLTDLKDIQGFWLGVIGRSLLRSLEESFQTSTRKEMKDSRSGEIRSPSLRSSRSHHIRRTEIDCLGLDELESICQT